MRLTRRLGYIFRSYGGVHWKDRDRDKDLSSYFIRKVIIVAMGMGVTTFGGLLDVDCRLIYIREWKIS